MTHASRLHPLYEPAELASVMRLLAEAPNRRSFFATLHEALPRLLPATRTDILANEPYNGDYVLLTSGTEASAPLPETRTAAGFAEWLSSQGYGAVSTVPLSGAGQHLGWLLLARTHGPFEPNTLALAGQLAALIALRLIYDQRHDDLAEHDTYSVLIEQRLREVEVMRQRAMMAAGAAHDISNLLTAIVGYIELLEQGAPPTLHPDLQAIARAANDGQQLIRRLLAVYMPKPGIGPAPITLLPTVIRDAIKMTQPFWEARADIMIKTILAPVPPTRGNAVELREVLINLIMNAIAAMPGGGTLTVRSLVAGQRVLVTITDTGEGIAGEHQSVIFQPYVTMRREGTGLGLSVSRAIVESYGGTLTVESAPGAGATFTLALPAIRSLETLYEAQPALYKPYVTS
jgi:signal transduction histidine kinase